MWNYTKKIVVDIEYYFIANLLLAVILLILNSLISGKEILELINRLTMTVVVATVISYMLSLIKLDIEYLDQSSFYFQYKKATDYTVMYGCSMFSIKYTFNYENLFQGDSILDIVMISGIGLVIFLYNSNPLVKIDPK